VFWTHNDGHSPYLFAVTRKGQTIRAYQVGASFVDWEDIAVDAAGNLYLADIGADGTRDPR